MTAILSMLYLVNTNVDGMMDETDTQCCFKTCARAGNILFTRNIHHIQRPQHTGTYCGILSRHRYHCSDPRGTDC